MMAERRLMIDYETRQQSKKRHEVIPHYKTSECLLIVREDRLSLSPALTNLHQVIYVEKEEKFIHFHR